MIPLAVPQISERGIEDVAEILRAGTLSTGEVVAEFEAATCRLTNRGHGVAVASGSVALELALEAAFEPGDTVAISPYNCGSVLYSVLRTDLEPVFVDADPKTGAISPSSLELVTPDGVLLTHLFGRPAAIEEVRRVAELLDAPVVEDFAQAPGASYRDRPLGSFGVASVCSFGATKNLTTAEGGVVVTDDESIREYVAAQRTNTADVDPPPRSVRMNDVEAAIGLSQLAEYDNVVDRKREIADTYRRSLTDVELLPERTDTDPVHHAFPVLHENADELAVHLERNHVGTSRLYNTPLTDYATAPPVDGGYPVAERFSDQVVLLPIHAALSDEDVRSVTEIVRDFASNQ